MALTFYSTGHSYLDMPVQEFISSEQTQEIKLSDSMPDIGRVIAAWGQPILRGKEWRSSGISASGGMMVWVLYAPEDGSRERGLSAWIPFPMKWDLPEGTPDGQIRLQCLPRFVDARSVSPRKIMVRAGMSSAVQALTPASVEVFAPSAAAPTVQILESTYPIRLNKEAGEKSFQLEEDLALPDSAPRPEQIIYYRMNPRITDKKVLSNKIVFRGNGNLHVLYRSEEGQLHGWDFELPFSHYVQLDGEYSPDAQGDILLMPTGAELELNDEGQLRFKGGLTAQYLISDKELLQLAEDAYAPGRELTMNREELTIPAQLETRRENLYGEQTIPAQANLTADVSFQPDYPRIRRGDDRVEMEVPGAFQVLYYGEDGILRSATARWEGRQTIPADENSSITAIPMAAEPQAMTGNSQILVKAELPVEVTTTAQEQIPMLTGVTLGEPVQADPNRPTLILRRAGENRLWDIAKENGSTVAAIQRANGLNTEPEPGRMLLIPVS